MGVSAYGGALALAKSECDDLRMVPRFGGFFQRRVDAVGFFPNHLRPRSLAVASSSNRKLAVSMAENVCILAVDPGITGGLAFYFTAAPNMIAAEDIPTAGDMVDGASLGRRIRLMAPDVAVIERVSAMPKQGVSSTFRFGQAYGIAIGVISGLSIPLHYVTPGKWKRHFALGADKEESRARALQLFPERSEAFSRKKDHGRAEAALLARYFAETRAS